MEHPKTRGRPKGKMSEEEKAARKAAREASKGGFVTPNDRKLAAERRAKRKADKLIIEDHMRALLESPKASQVLTKIVNAALDDDHKNQAAAWKIVTDRIMPLSYFEKDKNGNGKAAVQITISGVGGTTTIGAPNPEEDVIDGDFTET